VELLEQWSRFARDPVDQPRPRSGFTLLVGYILRRIRERALFAT
jgi:hypothetical protein